MMLRSWRKTKSYLPGFAAVALLLLPSFAFAANEIQATLYTIVVAVFGWLVYVGGALLDLGLSSFVFQFAQNYVDIFGFAVDYLWSVVRDLINLTFIFGLIYIGFRLIFDAEDSKARRALVMLIGAALLVNFSLFISKTVIDLTNITAFEIAKGIDVLDPSNSQVSATGENDIAAQFMDILGIQSVLSLGDNFAVGQEKFETFEGGGGYAYIFGIMIIFFVTAFVFAAGGILMIIRFVALCIYMILSPIMFMGWIIPSLSRFSQMWWKRFLGQAFMAPAYIFMLYLSMFILSSIQKSDLAGKGIDEAFNPASATNQINFAQTVAYIAVAIGFLVASLIVAKMMSAAGANASVSIGNSLRKRGQRIMTQPGRFVARNAVNKAGIAGEQAFDRAQRSSRLRSTRAGKFISNRLRSTSLDETVRGTTKKAQEAKFGLATTVSDNRKRAATIQSRADQQEKIDNGLDAQHALATGAAITASERAVLESKAKAKKTTLKALGEAETSRMLQEEREKRVAAMQSTINDISVKEFESMTQKERERMAGMMNPTTYEKLLESDNLNSSETGGLYVARQNAIKETIHRSVAGTNKLVTEELTKLTTAQLETLGDEFIRDNAHLLSSTQMDDLKKSKKFTETQKDAFQASRKQKVESYANTRVGARELFNQSTGDRTPGKEYKLRRPAEIAQLPREALLSDSGLQYINSSVLEQIFEKKTLSPADRSALKAKILQSGSAPQDAKDYLNSSLGQRNYS